MADASRFVWSTLAGEVNVGNLYLEPGVAARCASRCEIFIDQLEELKHRAYGLQYINGFGTFPSGTALAEKFSRKAVGGTYSMVDALNDHITEVEAMREMFLRIEAQYRAADDGGAARFSVIDGDVGDGR